MSTYILLNHDDVGYPALDGGLVEFGEVRPPLKRVAIACKNNGLRLEPSISAAVQPPLVVFPA